VPAIQYSCSGEAKALCQEGSLSVSQVGLKDPVSTSDRKMSRGRLQLGGRSRESRSWVLWNLENSERKVCVKL